ncbi:MAG: bifunctional hydroxymethylpyrimidine kinase/phosphomethylpyrimidine kinase, partial [Planctomycetota bacterium]
GAQGDLKTFAAHGVDGTAVLTALTVQGRRGVSRVEPVAPDLVAEQLAVVLEEFRPAGVKTGMLWDGALIRVVAEGLEKRGGVPLVVDPVLVATSGGALLRPDALPALQDVLVPQADVITPNLHEGARLLGRAEIAEEEMEDAAEALLALGARAVLLKGGHGGGDEAVDVLASGDGVRALRRPRIPDANAHGTGCALSAALAARLARGESLRRAAEGAKDYVHRALAAAAARGPGAPLVHAVPA